MYCVKMYSLSSTSYLLLFNFIVSLLLYYKFLYISFTDKYYLSARYFIIICLKCIIIYVTRSFSVHLNKYYSYLSLKRTKPFYDLNVWVFSLLSCLLSSFQCKFLLFRNYSGFSTFCYLEIDRAIYFIIIKCLGM